MIGQGVQYVIKSMSQAGDIVVMDLRTLITKTLPAQFGRPHVPVTIEELHVFCCMLGNDYIPTGNKGEGLVKCANKFKEYLSDDTEDGRKMWLSDYTKEHDSPEKIEMALFAWQHGPAFIIVPKNSNIHPKEAFISGEYSRVQHRAREHVCSPCNMLCRFLSTRAQKSKAWIHTSSADS